MYIGHFAPAFVASAATDEAPKLGTLFIAAQLVDWAFFTLVLFGIEKLQIVPGITTMNPLDLYHMPFTHSLLGSCVFALGFAAVIFLATRNGVAATWGGLVVVAHWFLDLLVHRPDLTIAGGSEKLGFGLWNYPAIEMTLESGIFILAFWWWMRRTDGPVLPPLVLFGVMMLFQAINWFGPPPAEAGAGLALLALSSFALVTALAYWVGAVRWHKRQSGLADATAPR